MFTRSFTGNDFFTLIRNAPEWTSSRGMFPGQDGSKRYVIIDAIFYKLDIFIRTPSLKFTDEARARQTANPNIRVIANGQFFCHVSNQWTGQSCYHHTSPGATEWQGEIIRSHIVSTGDPPSRSRYYHYGQFDGLTARSYDVARGNPSAVTRDGGYNSALGALLPLISAGVKATPAQLGSMWTEPATRGKICLGIHRISNTIFVFAEQDGSGSITIPDLQDLLHNMGVDDVALADSGSSSTLVVDATTEVAPGGSADRKNKSIPNGPQFSLIELSIAPSPRTQIHLNVTSTTNSDFLSTSPTVNPLFYQGQAVRGFMGTVRIKSVGYEFEVNSFGLYDNPSTPVHDALEAARLLGISLPLILTAPVENFSTNIDFVSSGTSPSVEASLRHIATTSADKGKLEGTMLIRTSSGNISLNVSLQIS